MTTLECPRCGVRWDESWSRLCWVCGTPGESSTAVNGGWRHCPGAPVPLGLGTGEIMPGRPFADLPPAPEKLVRNEEMP